MNEQSLLLFDAILAYRSLSLLLPKLDELLATQRRLNSMYGYAPWYILCLVALRGKCFRLETLCARAERGRRCG